MSANGRKASMELTKSSGSKSFICRIVEDINKNGVLKIPSNFAACFSSLGLHKVGLHVPLTNTWVGRFDSDSETFQGIETLLKAYHVNPWYMFCLEYIGGTEFTVEIFNEYAVEVDYNNIVASGEHNVQPSEMEGSRMFAVFALTEVQKDKLQSAFSYNGGSTFEVEQEFVIDDKHVEGKELTEVLSLEEAADIGIDTEMEWIELGFKRIWWKIKLQWKRNRLLFGREWNDFARACSLVIGDKCILVSTNEEGRFEVVILHKEQCKAVYKSGSVEGKGHLKWLKQLNWISVHTGELEVPPVFVEKYGNEIEKNCEIYLPDGMFYNCYFSSSNRLLFGLKSVMRKYNVEENFTVFIEYVGKSKFYATIYNEDGLEIFNNLQEKLTAYTMVKSSAGEVYMISDSDSEEGNNSVENVGAASTIEQPLHTEGGGLSSFSVKLLKSHVDQNNHGVFLPRYMREVYKNWNKSTTVKLTMDGNHHDLKVLRRKKDCRLGVGWNEFTLNRALEEGDILEFTLTGNTTFEVKKSV